MIKNASLYKAVAIIDVFLVDEDNKVIRRIKDAIVKIGKKTYDLKDSIYTKLDDNATLIHGIKIYKKVIVELDKASLKDVTWKVISSPKEIMFLPGKSEHFTFYVKTTGEIDGVINYDDGNNSIIPLSGVTVNLVDVLGDTIQSTKTEFDGYYIFTKIDSDRYKIEIDKKDLLKYNKRIIF